MYANSSTTVAHPAGGIPEHSTCGSRLYSLHLQQIDYEETFALVVKWSSICILLTLATQSNLEVHQMDVKMAFLNGNLEHDIFMQPPPGCANYGWKDLVWKLEKSLYGLKQASQSWYMKAMNELKKLHFSHADSDHAVFIYSNKGPFCIIVLYVDDLMILSNHLPLLQKKSQLMSTFKMKDLGEIHWFLSLEITCDQPQHLLLISQSCYITNVIHCFSFSNSHHVSTPMASDLKLGLHDHPMPNVDA